MITEEFRAIAKEYVIDLVYRHAEDIENLTIWETAKDWPGMKLTKQSDGYEDLNDEEYDYIFDLLKDVEIIVRFP